MTVPPSSPLRRLDVPRTYPCIPKILGSAIGNTPSPLSAPPAVHDVFGHLAQLKALQTVQREAQERYEAAVASGSKDLPGRIVGVCVGKGEAMGMLLGERGVVCVGWKAGEELARTVASCDIMVAPSEVRTPIPLSNVFVSWASCCDRGMAWWFKAGSRWARRRLGTRDIPSNPITVHRALGVETFACLSYVPVDFENASIEDASSVSAESVLYSQSLSSGIRPR